MNANVVTLWNSRSRSMSYKGAVHRPLICVVFCLFGVFHEGRKQVPVGRRLGGRARSEVGHESRARPGRIAGGCSLCGPVRGRHLRGDRGTGRKRRLEWLRKYLKLEQGIPSHDTFGRVFAAIDPDEFGAAFVRWVGQVLPVLTNGDVVAIDGKTSRRSGKVGATPFIWSAPLRPRRVWCWDSARPPEVEREDRHPGTAGDLGPGRLHRHHRCHGHAAEHCASHSGSGRGLPPGGQGQSAHAGRIDRRLLHRLRGGTSQDAPPVPRSRREGSWPDRSASLLRLQPAGLSARPRALARPEIVCGDHQRTDHQGESDFD